MKIQLDTSAKTIKLESNEKLSDLIDTLEKLLPGLWKEFTIETNVTINNWNYPIIYKQSEPYWYKQPWFVQCVYNTTLNTCDNLTDGGNSVQLNSGVFNIEC